ncbi:hypothetical protein Kpol_513p4 [Vanderwaltozyma polyspora DSM 70294]|uniref:Uncharacterized protein n=1 Tax=Vanderwaltozyma polyspora (strain ATCC 22028 / DSM 70294 / BCRC 21397 / CBS 2163 / NBRC 10782 / NRRL Y-8283 / UCD 57-17) TaxID=436907 RepID=A7TMJ0_VANPO|nr:uncharacterized protein Kpol_513p4 [Vanderwaltozyma polyspora DSM 70294]EDO16488.1 hypothetical protein Kpol_513p4 [Vanderwaltozyma polyspora DSM 70294]
MSSAFQLSDDEFSSATNFSFPRPVTSESSPERKGCITPPEEYPRPNLGFGYSDNKIGSKSIHRRQQTPISFNILDNSQDQPEYTKTYYSHRLSSIDIMNDTKNQIRRNSTGIFSSLGEFAKLNKIDTENKIFANCPESGDCNNFPKIDLNVSNEKINEKK